MLVHMQKEAFVRGRAAVIKVAKPLMGTENTRIAAERREVCSLVRDKCTRKVGKK